MGADRQPRGHRGGDAARGLAGVAVRAPAPVHRVRVRIRRGVARLRAGGLARAARAVPRAPGRVRRAAGAGLAGDHPRDLPAAPARCGDRDLRHGLGARPDRRTGGRRLPERDLRLALRVLHDGAVQRGRVRRHLALHPRPRVANAGAARLARLPAPRRRAGQPAGHARPRRARRLVRLRRDHRLLRGRPCRVLRVRRAQRDRGVVRSCSRRSSAIATSRSGSS